MANPFEGFEDAVCCAVPLWTATSFRIGGPAQYLIEPRNLDELVALLDRCRDNAIPVRMLGGGSNILVSDRGVTGAVFRLSRMTALRRNNAQVVCEAGVSLPMLVRQAEAWGLSGLEPLAGIPGVLGGALAMNAGGAHGCIADTLQHVKTLDRYGRLRDRSPQRLRMAYRQSHLHGEVVLGAAFRLTPKDPAQIRKTYRQVFQDKARSQPLAAPSAGCVFKNPPGRGAGSLIDQAHLKGEHVGDAVVSNKHANFILNRGHATATDVRRLIDNVRRRVRRRLGVELKLEIELWN